jgi:hypothetical protein
MAHRFFHYSRHSKYSKALFCEDPEQRQIGEFAYDCGSQVLGVKPFIEFSPKRSFVQRK